MKHSGIAKFGLGLIAFTVSAQAKVVRIEVREQRDWANVNRHRKRDPL